MTHMFNVAHDSVQMLSQETVHLIQIKMAPTENVPNCQTSFIRLYLVEYILIEPVHEISNNVVCATSRASDQPAHMRSLIRAFASRLSVL